MKKTYHSNRLLYNRAIINKIAELAEEYPDLRFNQLLEIADVITLKNGEIEDKFYEESEQTWKRLLENKICFPE